ncbi:MAG: HAD-IC family P-type ATPase [Candidatus Sungbacteria bacterium]|nr:HAD-IC family P-type ATPase [bacterium]MDZ4260244.1 HAD-IC family P-type ATPase [Candidatus Sungbacteria bacterium]
MFDPENIKKPFWVLGIEDAMSLLHTSAEGLNNDEARERVLRFGANAIKQKNRLPKVKIILNQFKSPLILILVFASALTFLLGESLNTAVILAAVIANTLFGFWQENKAEHALELLTSYIRMRARVRRSGSEHEIDAQDVVPGDIIRITQGDRVPADCRLIFLNSLEIDESILTGESLPIEKNIESVPEATLVASATPMVFAGTSVVRGFADAVVTATGEYTEFGKIASLIAQKERVLTPLQRAVARFSRGVGITLLILTTLLFGLGIYLGYSLYAMFLIAVSVAVSSVPEGLPVALTIILAIGVERLAKRNAVVRRLLAAETLGSTTLILTDKTGTLTMAKMELVSVIAHGMARSADERSLIEQALLNTDVIVENPDDDPSQWHLVGGAIEIALVRGAAKQGIIYPVLMREMQVIDRRPFSSEYKFSASVSLTDHKRRTVLLGAPEILIEFTTLSDEEKSPIKNEIERRAISGERLLGVISKIDHISVDSIHHQKVFSGFEFKGIIAFRDPVRPSVKDAILRIREQGIRTIMVTGDHQGTAESVAREVGLVDGLCRVITGQELALLSPAELDARADNTNVYARITPAQKELLVKLYQKRGEIVAVTGDGINDAPALKAADIGIAVGSGTDVTKSAADLVILDDNFETIVTAIEEGKRILQNIRKVIVYLLSDTLDEVLLIGGSLMLGLALPLNALQILFVNFFSDSFPAIAFAFEKHGVVSSPRAVDAKNLLFDRTIKIFILAIGISTSFLLFVLYAFLLRFGFDPALVRTFIFASFASYTLLLSFSLRSFEKSIFTYNPFSNGYLTAGVLLGVVMTFSAVYIPALQRVFETVPLPFAWVLGVIGVGLFNIVLVEIAKALMQYKKTI